MLGGTSLGRLLLLRGKPRVFSLALPLSRSLASSALTQRRLLYIVCRVRPRRPVGTTCHLPVIYLSSTSHLPACGPSCPSAYLGSTETGSTTPYSSTPKTQKKGWVNTITSYWTIRNNCLARAHACPPPCQCLPTAGQSVSSHASLNSPRTPSVRGRIDDAQLAVCHQTGSIRMCLCV